MFQKKKISAQEEEDASDDEDDDLDCDWAILLGVRMGFSYSEVQKMRYGKLLDFVEAQKEFIRKRPVEKQEEKRSSLMDL